MAVMKRAARARHHRPDHRRSGLPRRPRPKHPLSMPDQPQLVSPGRALSRPSTTILAADACALASNRSLCPVTDWRIEAMHHVLNVWLNREERQICTAAGVVGAIRRLAYAVIADLRGALSFRRFAEIMRANPTPLLEICHSCR